MGKDLKLGTKSEHYKVCAECSKRSESCHTSCEEYAKEVIFGIMLSAAVNKEMAENCDANDYHAKRQIEKIKAKHPDNRYRRTSIKRR